MVRLDGFEASGLGEEVDFLSSDLHVIQCFVIKCISKTFLFHFDQKAVLIMPCCSSEVNRPLRVSNALYPVLSCVTSYYYYYYYYYYERI